MKAGIEQQILHAQLVGQDDRYHQPTITITVMRQVELLGDEQKRITSGLMSLCTMPCK
jgi:hypothetical protein